MRRKKTKRTEVPAPKPGTVKAGEIASELWVELGVSPRQGLEGGSSFIRPGFSDLAAVRSLSRRQVVCHQFTGSDHQQPKQVGCCTWHHACPQPCAKQEVEMVTWSGTSLDHQLQLVCCS